MDEFPLVIGITAVNLLAIGLVMILPSAWLALPAMMILLTIVTAGLLLWGRGRGRGWGRERRPCPDCGHPARSESRICGMCGHDFE